MYIPIRFFFFPPFLLLPRGPSPSSKSHRDPAAQVPSAAQIPAALLRPHLSRPIPCSGGPVFPSLLVLPLLRRSSPLRQADGHLFSYCRRPTPPCRRSPTGATRHPPAVPLQAPPAALQALPCRRPPLPCRHTPAGAPPRAGAPLQACVCRRPSSCRHPTAGASPLLQTLLFPSPLRLFSFLFYCFTI